MTSLISLLSFKEGIGDEIVLQIVEEFILLSRARGNS